MNKRKIGVVMGAVAAAIFTGTTLNDRDASPPLKKFPTNLNLNQQAGLVRSEFIFEKAPHPECHASTLAETKDGLVAAWFGGTREQNPDVGIWVSRQVDNRWTPPTEVANGVQPDGTRQPTWNPVLFQPRTGPLQLFYKVGSSPRHWWGERKTSSDGGKTWSKAIKLPEGILGPIKNKPVQLADGAWLSPSSTEAPITKLWKAHFERSNDGGKTWSVAYPEPNAVGEGVWAIQPSILLYPDGKLQAVGRSRSQRIFETWSSDGGKTWSALALTSLPNSNSGTDAVTLRDGRQLMVYNHTTEGRSPLNVAVSKDGRQWQAAFVLETKSGQEYSYPAVIQDSKGLVHITYTYNRLRIKHVVLDPKKLKLQPMNDGNWPGATG